MLFLGNIQYVLIAVVGGLRISTRRHHARRHAGLHPVRPPVLPAAHPPGLDGHRVPVGHRLARAGARAARRRRSRVAEQDDTVDPPPVRGRVVFDDVHFSYDPDAPLIEGLSVVAEPGQTVAIVGPTGAGKTTLVNLIMRFYDLDSGTISLDGRDIAGLPSARAAVEGRHGAPGHVAVRRDDPRQHRLRQPGGHRGADPRGGPGHLRRPLRPLPARRLRHGDQRRGRQHQRRARSSCSPSPARSSPTRRS